ncbi:MAG TPA: hypothetical protein VFT95_14395, partial [Micromonosporaceae bacterium]|nr:hypothetical protein [Micromonosporaceae bacterium]
MTGGTALEARYRRLLRVLPADYRAAWSDDMVDTFLESMRTGDPEADDFLADYGRPPRGEVLSVLGLAVRLRLGGAGGSARYALWGAAVRRFALVGLLTAAAFGLSGAVFRLWLAGEVPVLPPQDELAAPMPADLVGVAAQLSGLLWLPVYLAVVLGHWRVARGLGALALVPAVATVAVNVAGVLA